MAKDNFWFLKNCREVGKNETPFWSFFLYKYTELKNKLKNYFYKDLELSKGRNFKWNYINFAAKTWVLKLYSFNPKYFIYFSCSWRVLVLRFLINEWEETMFIDVQFMLVLTLQGTFKKIFYQIKSFSSLVWKNTIKIPPNKRLVFKI